MYKYKNTMNFINYLLIKVLGPENKNSIENRFILSSLVYSSIVCFISVFANIAMGLGCISVLIVLVSSIVYAMGYIIGRFKGKINIAKLIFTIHSLLFCNAYWLYNFGTRGAALYIFLVANIMMVFMWDNKYIAIITTIMLINILFLFVFEHLNPNMIPYYPSEQARVSDGYITFIIYFGILSILSITAKNNYKHQYELAKRSDILKSAFLANMSHEIRTPLNAIVGFSQMLTKRELTKDKKEQFSKIINDNSKYLHNLISDILDISLIESGQLKIIYDNFNINELLHKIYMNHDTIIKEAGKKEVKLKLKIQNEPLFIKADELRVEQILSNLITNAIKFTANGHVIIGYYINVNEIIFYVEDTGTGIKEDLQTEIFNRFVKSDEMSDKKFERGAGIGLALSKELVNVFKGRIWFESKYGFGSTFYFSLPYNK